MVLQTEDTPINPIKNCPAMANYQSWDLNCLFSVFTIGMNSRFQKTHPSMFGQKPTSHKPSKHAVVEYGSCRCVPHMGGRITHPLQKHNQHNITVKTRL